MKPAARKFSIGIGSLIWALVAASGAWAQGGYSHARVVRLSFVEGTVTLQRPDIDEWAEATVNTPIQEGFRLATAKGSFAEVEFENGSTVRVGEQSEIDFAELALAPSGARINRLVLNQGYATFHALPEGQDVYEIKAGVATLSPRGEALFRIDLDQNLMRVEAFEGTVETSSVYGTWDLTENQVLQLQPGATPADTLSEGITEDDWDKWVDERESQMSAGTNAPGAAPPYNSVNAIIDGYNYGPFYGWNDLSLYGTWSYMIGGGYGWVPRVSEGWSPFTLGHWCRYPGLGWTWISNEPWGWLPYHYGNWGFFHGVGWCWFPSNLGAWSPATVNWYQGPGWVGWTPRTLGSGGPYGCPSGQGCMVAVNTHTFQDGGPVTPQTMMQVNGASGRPVNQPEVQPTLNARLPGMPTTAAAGAPGGAQAIHGRPVTDGAARGTGTSSPTFVSPGGVAAGHGPGVPGAGIVYDPAEGRYVNGPTPPAAARPASASTPGVQPVHNAPRAGAGPSGSTKGTSSEAGTVTTPSGGSNASRMAPQAFAASGEANGGEASAPANGTRFAPRPVTPPSAGSNAPRRAPRSSAADNDVNGRGTASRAAPGAEPAPSEGWHGSGEAPQGVAPRARDGSPSGSGSFIHTGPSPHAFGGAGRPSSGMGSGPGVAGHASGSAAVGWSGGAGGHAGSTGGGGGGHAGGASGGGPK